MKYFFLVSGIALMLFSVYIIFQPEGFTDKHFTMSLLSGIMFSFIGFSLEAYNIEAKSRSQSENRRKQLNSSIIVTIMSAALTVLAFFFI
jgi:hypothetical protein